MSTVNYATVIEASVCSLVSVSNCCWLFYNILADIYFIQFQSKLNTV